MPFHNTYRSSEFCSTSRLAKAVHLQVIKPIQVGEQLFVDYGPGWFEEGETRVPRQQLHSKLATAVGK
jgi:hypothetical protein